MASTKDEHANANQLSPLPGVERHITTHNTEGLAVFHSSTPAAWTNISPSMGFNVVYTTSTPTPVLNDEADISTHEEVMASGKLGLVNPNGSVCRMVDIAPSTAEAHSKPIMHRTESLDYGVVIHGEMECLLDSGEKRLMRPGDIAVQRGTMHAWRNASNTEWARMLFVLLSCDKVKIGDKELSADVLEVPEELKAVLKGRS
ncbi:MAG: hypothetical protein L6R39_004914 [Caloplaca ligustica]|nr:MAG: hypothetical protein L6R39_004914 [Caloplaca ligustica]